MSIHNLIDKIKSKTDIDNMTIVYLSIIVGVSIGSFGLGRISVNNGPDKGSNMTLKQTEGLLEAKNIKDANTPFRLMKITKLKPILNLIPLNYFLANVMISLFVVKRSESYLRIPITFQKRKAGVNSINLRRIIVIGYNAIGDFYTIKQNTKELIYGSNSEIR